MKKSFIALILAVVTVIGTIAACTPANASAASDNGIASTVSAVKSTGPKVSLNGTLIHFPDEQPFIKEGRTYIPVRFVAEAMGADVNWSREIYGAVIEKDGIELQLPIDSNIMTVIEGGKKSTVTMDAKAIKQNGRTLIPIRFVAEALGAWVSYSKAYSTVQIYDDILTPEEITELHALENHWNVCEERKALLDGRFDYENLNECAIRHFTSDIPYTITNFYTNATYTNGADPLEAKTLLLADYIRHDLAAEYTNDFLGVSATFRTDVSCIAATTVSTGSTYINRGYLTISFDEDADIDEFMSRKEHCKFGNVQPGGTYTYVIESVWMLNIATGRPQCMREHNVTNGVYQQWV